MGEVDHFVSTFAVWQGINISRYPTGARTTKDHQEENYLPIYQEQVHRIAMADEGTQARAAMTRISFSRLTNKWEFAMLGFLIYFLSQSMSSSSQSRLFTIARDWETRAAENSSLMTTIARKLVTQQILGRQILPVEEMEAEDDLVLRATLGLAMAAGKQTSTALSLLRDCVRDNNSKHIFGSSSYLIVVSELVKCYNILGQEYEGELLATSSLKDYDNTLGSIGKVYLEIALADALTGQNRFQAAEQKLSGISDGLIYPGYLTVAIALRLNKVKRRLERRDEDLCSSNGILWKAVEWLEHLDRTLKLEFTEEVNATLFQSGNEVREQTADAQRLVAATLRSLNSDHIMLRSRQVQRLQDHFKAMMIETKTVAGKQNDTELDNLSQKSEDVKTRGMDAWNAENILVLGEMINRLGSDTQTKINIQ